MRKVFLFLFVSIMISGAVRAQESDLNKVFQSALSAYDEADYNTSANHFTQLIELAGSIEKLSDYALYQGALIYVADSNTKKALEILTYLAEGRLYSDLEKIQNQKDFEQLHHTDEWKQIISKVTENKETYPARTREKTKNKLLEAKEILDKDNGKLWGHNIWSDSILVIDYDSSVYSLIHLADSKTDDNILYYKSFEPNTLTFVNTTQEYEGGQYATVLISYLSDKNSTIIHELFHLLQFRVRKFYGESIGYLDETNARILLRMEYQALKNTLSAINNSKGLDEVNLYLKDAVVFRKIRQQQYSEYLKNELEIETLEGLANYTGFVLSTHANKYKLAISEINQREQAETYTRPFPYATGPAYGLIFDYLGIDWRDGLDKIYNFAEIYENQVLKDELAIDELLIEQAKSRNNSDEIYQQETEREKKQKELTAYYSDLLINKPTLNVVLTDENYSRTFNMNGTMTLKDKGIIYSSIKGLDKSGGKNFGDFSTVEGKDQLGVAGILSYEDNGADYLVFPLPIEISGSKIIGEFYEISLNPEWTVVEYDDGNMEILKK